MDTSSETLNSNIAQRDKEKLNKCNLYDHAFGHAGDLRRHMKKHYGEKSYKCSQCDYASVQAGDLRRHLKKIMEKFRTSVTIVTLHLLKQPIWEDMWNQIFRKIAHMQLMWWIWEDMWKTNIRENQRHTINVSLHMFKKAIWEDTWKLTFGKITHMQLMWLCIWSSRQFEKMFENHLIEKFRTSAAIVPLHPFKQAIWEDVSK